MNDNRKSVLEQALDAVRDASESEDMTETEFRQLLEEFKVKLAECEARNALKKQSH